MQDLIPTLTCIHGAATWFMVGLIWFVQVVHYPLMGAVGADGYGTYQTAHMKLTSMVVVPIMCLELAAAVSLIFLFEQGPELILALRGFGLLVLIWLVTFLVIVPIHQTLLERFDADAHRRLVRANWIRTLGWTVRGVVAIGLF